MGGYFADPDEKAAFEDMVKAIDKAAEKRYKSMDRKHKHAQAAHKYNAKNTVQVPIRLNVKTDADILAKLETVASKQGYIKELIRRDMSRSE